MPIYADLETRFSYTNMHKSFTFCLLQDRVVPRRKKILLCTEMAFTLYQVTELPPDFNKPKMHSYIFMHELKST